MASVTGDSGGGEGRGGGLDMSRLFVREFERHDGSVLRLNQSEVGDVGCVVWDAAIVLASYLQTPDMREKQGGKPEKKQGEGHARGQGQTEEPVAGKSLLSARRAVELGAGPGLVGLQAACLGADCIITDLEEFLPLIQLNIKENSHLISGHAEAKALSWGSHGISQFLPHPDYIFLADCIYYDGSIEPLVQTLRDLSGQKTVILCSHEERTTGNKPLLQNQFFKLIEEHFVIEEIPQEKQDPVFSSSDIHIHRFTRKPNLT